MNQLRVKNSIKGAAHTAEHSRAPALKEQTSNDEQQRRLAVVVPCRKSAHRAHWLYL